MSKTDDKNATDPGMSMHMTSDRSGETELGRPFIAGTTVEYIGHLPGCAIRVRLADGSVQVVSPLCFKELR